MSEGALVAMGFSFVETGFGPFPLGFRFEDGRALHFEIKVSMRYALA